MIGTWTHFFLENRRRECLRREHYGHPQGNRRRSMRGRCTLEAFQSRVGLGVGGETEMRYTGERQRRDDRHGNGACLRRACRRISPLGSMVRDSSATVASSASCIPFER